MRFILDNAWPDLPEGTKSRFETFYDVIVCPRNMRKVVSDSNIDGKLKEAIFVNLPEYFDEPPKKWKSQVIDYKTYGDNFVGLVVVRLQCIDIKTLEQIIEILDQDYGIARTRYFDTNFNEVFYWTISRFHNIARRQDEN
jgi:hypothetical protein